MILITAVVDDILLLLPFIEACKSSPCNDGGEYGFASRASFAVCGL